MGQALRVKTCRGLGVGRRKEVLGCTSKLWNDGFVVSHIADSCQQRHDSASAKASVDHDPQSEKRYS